jgi:hypothetical protein
MAKKTRTAMVVAAKTESGESGLEQYVGKNVFVRTVTYHYTGRLTTLTPDMLVLDDAAWIADSGRWAGALKTGELSEVEPYPGRCLVARAAIVDVSEWGLILPREQK